MNQALIKHFKLSESEVAQIQGSLPPGQTLLVALFERNLLESTSYLAWAKDHYSLPVLKTAFLEQNNHVDMLLDRYKNVFPKNIIPFHEMDGVLYVMCLEPTPFDAPQAVQYVLAPYDVISQYAVKNETNIIHQEAVEVAQVKEETNPLFKDLSQKSESPLEGFNFENLTVGDAKTEAPQGAEESKEIKLEEKQDIPAGLSFPPNPTGEESFVSDKPVTSVDLNAFKFEGLMPVADEKKTEAKSAPVGKVATASELAAKHPPKPKVEAPAAPATPQAQAASQALKPLTPFSANDLAAKNPPKPKIETPVAAPTTSAPPPVVAPAPQAAPSQASVNAAAQFDGILNTMKKYFEKSMILMFKNGNLEPHAWDQSWVKVAHSQAAIDVSTPSIFRIVNETQRPYHGYVVPNLINDAFFGTWNSGQTPQHVTICPIIHEKRLYGMILGATTQEAAKKFQLHHIQEIANDAFAMLSSSKAA